MACSGIAHVDLAGDGGGDQRGAAFLQQVDGALGFGGEGVELGELGIEVGNDDCCSARGGNGIVKCDAARM